ncbi:nitroreductase family protein [Fructobacillus durionis]|uniref:Nitroreductase domain-containing protein n=1 Tax=Fructobacillus durionis TaxID=283737 RepID=A0A1I1HBX1_9LACO|nr:nitroreductase family protein [Fructobacillus durionis]SFC21341.1 hypothetical protein SAMN05660453_1322 [Fructobacillus durionis]
MTDFAKIQEERRSIYNLGKNVEQDSDELFSIIKGAIRETPSAFNSQSVRAVLLTGQAHEKLWQMTLDELKKVSASDEAFATTEAKVNNSFAAGVGTVLYFTDESIVDGLKEQAPTYADHFDDWAEEAIGISLYAVWLTLSNLGLGASLQHYNPLIDQAVQKAFDLPSNWTLRGQMPFGSIEGPANAKTYHDDDVRFMHFN